MYIIPNLSGTIDLPVTLLIVTCQRDIVFSFPTHTLIKIKADRPHLCDYLHIPTNYRHIITDTLDW